MQVSEPESNEIRQNRHDRLLRRPEAFHHDRRSVVHSQRQNFVQSPEIHHNLKRRRLSEGHGADTGRCIVYFLLIFSTYNRLVMPHRDEYAYAGRW